MPSSANPPVSRSEKKYPPAPPWWEFATVGLILISGSGHGDVTQRARTADEGVGRVGWGAVRTGFIFVDIALCGSKTKLSFSVVFEMRIAG